MHNCLWDAAFLTFFFNYLSFFTWSDDRVALDMSLNDNNRCKKKKSFFFFFVQLTVVLFFSLNRFMSNYEEDEVMQS